MRWYNHDHRHSGIRYVSPAQRHEGQDHAILAARHALYLRDKWLGSSEQFFPKDKWSHGGVNALGVAHEP